MQTVNQKQLYRLSCCYCKYIKNAKQEHAGANERKQSLMQDAQRKHVYGLNIATQHICTVPPRKKELRLTRKTLQFHFTGGRGVGAQNHYTVPRKRCTEWGGSPCYEERSSPSLWAALWSNPPASCVRSWVIPVKTRGETFWGQERKTSISIKMLHSVSFLLYQTRPLLYLPPFPSAHSCTNKIKTLPDPLVSESHPSGWMWGRKETLFFTIGRQQQRTRAPETPTEGNIYSDSMKQWGILLN